jgi:hypothetical protein
MDSKFVAHIEELRPLLQRLLQMKPAKPGDLPVLMPTGGVYLLSEGDCHLYVGRSNNVRSRLGRHSKLGATHRMASFAFRLAREKTGNLRATYKKGEGSRANLMEDPTFAAAFSDAKARIRHMDVRFVEETNPVRQSLLEIYVAVVLETPYNDFDNH